MSRVLLDSNIYDKLEHDEEARKKLAAAVDHCQIKVIATPVVADEMRQSPFCGFPDFFPISIEAEAVAVIGHACLGMARLGPGDVYTAHRGSSNNTKDAIIADSADKLADLFVSEDSRCRKRLSQVSTCCQAMSYDYFRAWLLAQTW